METNNKQIKKQKTLAARRAAVRKERLQFVIFYTVMVAIISMAATLMIAAAIIYCTGYTVAKKDNVVYAESNSDDTLKGIMPLENYHVHTFNVFHKDPTCYTDGYDLYTCTDCGYQYKDNEIKSLGHDYDEEVVEATYFEDGSITRVCKRCGYSEVEKLNKNDTEQPEDAAIYIWNKLSDAGYSDPVVAGILGNIMAEVGNTSNFQLRWDIYSTDGYYGICQWSSYYFPEAHGKNLKEQIEYLIDTIENQFGESYYDTFINMKDPAEAALSFAQNYERCSEFSYGVRQSNAIKAFERFAA